MTEEPRQPVPDEASRQPPALEEPPVMPPWVPALIGVVLVAMAALAVYTGIRYRSPTLANAVIKPRRPARAMTGGSGPPGEPEPGASLLFPGDSADNTPAAREAVSGRARAEITGTGHGITSTLRMWARRGMITNVIPDDAMVAVNDLVIGQAKQFRKMDEVYDFPAPGSYTVHISAVGYKDQQFIVTVAENAKQEIARLDVKLEKVP
ncbi:MAG: carboxypeptidase-like regulatory domain-containing protein [Acidobacteriota bacterium]|nr:carboxypeptidase-like regulatory domain-containing protein [Acidobacteriota bacterium]